MVAAVWLCGCQTANFRAVNLPPQFRAAEPKENVTVNLARIAAPGYSNTLISPGDVLDVTIVSGIVDERPLPMSVRVADDGTVDVPLIGPVQVGGLEPLAAGQNVAAAGVERGIYLQPHVAIDIKTKATNRVTVMGAVSQPGLHELPRSSSDLLSALAMAGGLTEDSGTEVEILRQSSQHSPTRYASNTPSTVEPASNADEEIQLTAYSQLFAKPPRGGIPHQVAASGEPKAMRIDLAAATTGATRKEDYRLEDRDVVMVLPRKKRKIYVSGLVKKPGEFELSISEDLRLLDAIAKAGGTSSIVANKVLIIRRIEGNPKPLVIQASLLKCKHNGQENLRIAAGDMISVENTPTTTFFDTFTRLIHMTIGISGRTTLF